MRTNCARSAADAARARSPVWGAARSRADSHARLPGGLLCWGRAAYFNLVFKTNTASIGLWERLGFTRLATVPSAARLKGYEVPTRPTWRGPQSAALVRVVVHGCHGATDPAREKPSAQCADVRMPCGVQGELIDAYQYWIDLTKHDHTSYKPRSSLHMLSIRAARQYCVFAPYGLALALATAAALGLHRRRSRT